LYNNKNNIIKDLNYKLKAVTNNFLNFTIKFFIYAVTLIAHFKKASGDATPNIKKQSNTLL